MARELSILIPARNERFLARTIEDILQNIEADTEVIAVLDGAWADPPIPQNERVTVIYFPESIGQRAATNQACRLAKADYVMKVDAHCSFDKGFDRKMLDAIKGHDNWTMVPTMKNLHAFNRVCPKCGHAEYQGPTMNCPTCGVEMIKQMVWKPRRGVTSNFYRFDNTLHFQYWKEFGERPEAKQEYPPTLSIQGSCFMLTRKKYWELDISSETFKSWGQQGVEVACKTWLSGGEVRVNPKTWYAHMFRTQGGDFSFPYPNPGSEVEKNRKLSRDLFMGDKWKGAAHPFKWLLDKFSPVPGWDVSKGTLYYSDGQLRKDILDRCQKQLIDATNGNRIVSVTLTKMGFGDNIHLNLDRGYLTMAKQILTGLKELQTDVVFFAEHDVLYHPSHFDFIPPRKDVVYYNTNVWRTRFEDGFAIRTDDTRQLSGLCAYRELLIKHYEKRVSLLEEKAGLFGEDSPDFRKYVREMGFEPGTHNRAERVDDLTSDRWESSYPNVDIRHGGNLTPSRWNPEQFRNKKFTEGWKETTNIPGWGNIKEYF